MSATESAGGAQSWEHIHPIPAAWFLVLCTVLSISCNTINLIVIPRLNDLADTSKVFYIALAIFDLTVTFIIILMIKPSLSGYWFYGEVACKAIGSLAGIVPSFSAATVTLLNIDRFILIIRPLRYPSIVTRRRCVTVIVSTCCSFVIIGLLEMEFAGDSFDIVRFRKFGICIIDSADKDFLPITILNYAISIWAQAVIITVLYLIVIKTTWRHTNDIARQEQSVFRIRKFSNRINPSLPTISCQDQVMKNDYQIAMRALAARKKKFLKSVTFVIAITGSYFICWIPYTISEITEPMFGRPVSLQAQVTFLYILVCTTWSNSVVYFIIIKQYRQEVFKLLKNLVMKFR